MSNVHLNIRTFMTILLSMSLLSACTLKERSDKSGPGIIDSLMAEMTIRLMCCRHFDF